MPLFPIPAASAAQALPDNRLARPLRDCLTDVPVTWHGVVAPFTDSAQGRALCAFVDERRADGIEIYPAQPLRALPEEGPASVRVVILGQDPYHGPGEAEGLAFSVPAGMKIPPSLRNIRKELATDLGVAVDPSCGSLASWVRQGVLLLNTSLTVERDQAGSHARRGWEALTDCLIDAVARDAQPKVFMFWGGHAQGKSGLLDASALARHLLLTSNHPSPLSALRPPRPFMGSRPFSRANDWLQARNLPPVDWGLAV